MDIQVLGGFSVRLNGVPVVPTAPKPRQVLALLALNADRAVPLRTLTEELWGAEPPRSSRATLQTYILQLRELIGEALAGPAGLRPGDRTGKDVLVTSPGGYRLETGGGHRDFGEFERLSNEGYRAMDKEDFTGAARALRDALALWQGPALADVNAGIHLDMETRRLEEARLCALDQRIEADLGLGRHRELLPELTVLVERHSMHESLHSQFMLALYRSGRGGEALHVYQRLRGTLVRNLGLEPSAPVRRLQRSILKASSDVTQDALFDGRTAPAAVS
ncbi:AfsR/SARP family transcriptional regulator [Streptomyces flavofungini]|uniref:AfsR/SARP family transcriptional regulator n=1 Tax=Streptomyces flavofungini TaxID=68200 RepID=UPI0034DF32E9